MCCFSLLPALKSIPPFSGLSSPQVSFADFSLSLSLPGA
jgi:hypothetical protein